MNALTLIERDRLDAFMRTRPVKKLMKNGGRVALVWGPNNGIGVPVLVTVMDQDGVVLSKNITDYSSW